METIRLSSGREVQIRPIRSSDAAALAAAYDRLSPQSKYNRFLAPKPYLSSSEVRYLVDVDGVNHLAFVVTPANDPGTIIGVSRLVRLPDDPDAAEFATVIADDYHGEGLATLLLERIADAARERGLRRIRATILAGNLAAHRLMHRLPAGELRERNFGTVDELEIDLTQ
ncbi:MAG: GNAT family N-acetyltransferase [Solirubrobacterales bacterium]|nr:GNAT family N-acetyltransferase [Solirubrobacterales bacterium]